jgi:hypothetical protein
MVIDVYLSTALYKTTALPRHWRRRTHHQGLELGTPDRTPVYRGLSWCGGDRRYLEHYTMVSSRSLLDAAYRTAYRPRPQILHAASAAIAFSLTG